MTKRRYTRVWLKNEQDANRRICPKCRRFLFRTEYLQITEPMVFTIELNCPYCRKSFVFLVTRGGKEQLKEAMPEQVIEVDMVMP